MGRMYLPPSVPPDEAAEAAEAEVSESVEVREPAPPLASLTEDGAPAAVAPAKNASKADWVDYAVSQGANRADAEALTRDELADRYGS